jgi:cytidine deaminase
LKYRDLIAAAVKAKSRSHSPYSGFRVGAALLARSGKVYSGCNIESSSFSLTVCAERTALFKAVSESDRKFKAMAIATDSPRFVSPCGACRQVILDLAGSIDIVLVNSGGKTRTYRSKSLLPAPFLDKLLPARRKRGTRHSS